MTREALMLMINSAGKMAKRIIFDATNSTRVRVNYDITGSGKNLDKLSSEEFAEMIFQKVEKANKNFKVSGKLFVEKDANGNVSILGNLNVQGKTTTVNTSVCDTFVQIVTPSVPYYLLHYFGRGST